MYFLTATLTGSGVKPVAKSQRAFLLNWVLNVPWVSEFLFSCGRRSASCVAQKVDAVGSSGAHSLASSSSSTQVLGKSNAFAVWVASPACLDEEIGSLMKERA